MKIPTRERDEMDLEILFLRNEGLTHLEISRLLSGVTKGQAIGVCKRVKAADLEESGEPAGLVGQWYP